VNLALRIGARRPDGFHEVDTVLQTLELADEICLSFNGSPRLTVGGPFAAGTPVDDSNLAWRAAAELARLSGHALDRLSIHLEKRIPPAGGLGGGASDAATTLRLLQRAWGNVSEETLFEAANAVGSDEAFFLVGGTARAQGRGDRVSRLPDLSRHEVVLFVPPMAIANKTARMFAEFDALPTGRDADAERVILAPPSGVTLEAGFNSFAEVAFAVFPGLGELRDGIQARIGAAVSLAGAGPTLFWIGAVGEGRSISARAAGLPCAVIETATANSLWRP